MGLVVYLGESSLYEHLHASQVALSGVHKTRSSIEHKLLQVRRRGSTAVRAERGDLECSVQAGSTPGQGRWQGALRFCLAEPTHCVPIMLRGVVEDSLEQSYCSHADTTGDHKHRTSGAQVTRAAAYKAHHATVPAEPELQAQPASLAFPCALICGHCCPGPQHSLLHPSRAHIPIRLQPRAAPLPADAALPHSPTAPQTKALGSPFTPPGLAASRRPLLMSRGLSAGWHPAS